MGLLEMNFIICQLILILKVRSRENNLPYKFLNCAILHACIYILFVYSLCMTIDGNVLLQFLLDLTNTGYFFIFQPYSE